jgi:hypothetical protein
MPILRLTAMERTSIWLYLYPVIEDWSPKVVIFLAWYSQHDRHNGIRLLTPNHRHGSQAEDICHHRPDHIYEKPR